MKALSISAETAQKINAAVERARAQPLPWESVREGIVADASTHLALKDRKPGFERSIASEFVEIPGGFIAAISFEHQPTGLCRHLSISVNYPLDPSIPLEPMLLPPMPAKEVMAEIVMTIAEAFGFRVPVRDNVAKAWSEEYAPKEYALNLLQLEAH